MIKNNFNEELVITKEDDENFESSTRHWIYDNTFVEGYVKLRDQCHITGKCRGAANRDCNINISLNYKTPIVLHNLKNYDAHLIMQELGKLDFQINALPNRLEKIY